jgi:hypothetical protein
VILRATIESPDGERRNLEVVAASFEQGCAELDQLRPDRWREMHIIVDR